MKCKGKKILSFISAVVILFSSSSLITFAAESGSNVIELETTIEEIESVTGAVPYSTTFADTSISISYSSSGMSVTIHTTTTMQASVIGVKDIEVQVKSGNNWVTVATGSGGEVTNSSACACSFTYPYSIKGETYRVVCTHYANVDGYRELYHETLGAKCTY